MSEHPPSGRATSFRLTEQHYERLDSLVRQRKTNRSEVIRWLIEQATEAAPAPKCETNHRNWKAVLGGALRRCQDCGMVSRDHGANWELP